MGLYSFCKKLLENYIKLICNLFLPQEFVQRDALQTCNVLEQLLSQKGNSDILVPLFQPNLSPDQFVNMYGTAAEMAVKDSPSVAFAVLTKVKNDYF